MSQLLLHYAGLKQGQGSWYYNRRFGQVTIYPGEWVRLDLSEHPEVMPSIQSGAAVIRDSAPLGMEVLDERTDANRGDRASGEERAELPPRERGPGRPEVLALTMDDLERVARCLLPWTNCTSDLKMDFVDARPDKRGAPLDSSLPILFEMNFVVLYRVAELLARCEIEQARSAREQVVQSRHSEAYASKAECKRFIYESRPLPDRHGLILARLRKWKVWLKDELPSASTLRRHRATFVSDFPFRGYVDSQILYLHNMPRQRIFLGRRSDFLIGPYVPGKAASVLSSIGTVVGSVIIDLLPSVQEDPHAKRRMQVSVRFKPSDRARLASLLHPALSRDPEPSQG